MAHLFHLNISTPRETIFDGTIQSLVAPGEIGYLGILANHAPLITTLVPGKITVRDTYGKHSIFNSSGGGLLEVSENQAVILADSIA